MSTEIEVLGSNVRSIDPEDEIEIGQWYWRKREKTEDERLVCIIRIGSNYAEYDGPSEEWAESHHTGRVHFSKFFDQMRFEPNPDAYIDSVINHHQGEVRRLMGEVQDKMSQLGVTPKKKLTDQTETQALSVRNESLDYSTYTEALVKAKNKELPDMFKEIKTHNDLSASWMKAKLIPLKAAAGGMKGLIDSIEDRIFNVEIYAGLVEQVVQVREGDPGPEDDKVHMMQRRLYMDEESLLSYTAGGLRFEQVGDFDEWLSKDENFERILPFQKCVVSFRVRRNLDRRPPLGANIFFWRDNDVATYMYMRNGEQLFRMASKLEFGEKLFPNPSDMNFNQQMWVRIDYGSVKEMITDNHRQQMIDEEEEAERTYKMILLKHRQVEARWSSLTEDELNDYKFKQKSYGEDENGRTDYDNWTWEPRDPPKPTTNSDKYTPFNDDTVYYDDIEHKISTEVKHYNRIALIMQGLFDRSPVFAPHPKRKLWSGNGFNEAIELHLDSDMALYPTEEPPDFEAYRRKCNESLTAGSVVVGQDRFWMRKEADKERDKRNYWEHRSDVGEFHIPYGNPGPGHLARVDKCTKRSKKCTFRWLREKLTGYGGKVKCVLTVPPEELFNCDAYEPGDFKQFFQDPRTRADYLQWAPLLLTAEDYKGGKRIPREPG